MNFLRNLLRNDNTLLIVIALIGITFLTFLFSTAISVRPCSDDLFFYEAYREKGWFYSVFEMNINIRFTGFYVFNTICLFATEFSQLANAFKYYYWLLFIFLVISSFSLFKSLLRCFFPKVKVDKLYLFSFTCLFLSSFYFSTINSQEVWFWTIANCIYLLPIPLLNLAVIELIKPKATYSNLKLFILFLLIGGNVENLTLVITSVLLTMLYYAWIVKKLINKQILISILGIIIFPLISLLSKGINRRINMEKYYILEKGYFNTLFSDFQFVFNAKRILILMLIYLLIFSVGVILKKRGAELKLNVKKLFINNLIILTLIFFCTFLPMIHVFGNFGPARASLPFIFSFNLSMIFWLFYLGLNIEIKTKFTLLIGCLLLFIISIFTIKQYKTTQNFANLYDQRIRYIKSKIKTKSTTIFVVPLPDSGVIPAQEVNKIGETKIGMTTLKLGKLNGVNKEIYLKKSKS